MTDLTVRIERHIVQLFAPAEHAEVRRLRASTCAAAALVAGNASPEAYERIHCAALKLSEGRFDKLYDAIALAQTDWRDLLVVAGFAQRTDAHLDWQP